MKTLICSKCGYEKFNPRINIYPGETLKDVLKHENLTYKELASKIGFSAIFIATICTGKRNISYKFAYALEKELLISAEFWLNLQNSYDLHNLRNKECEYFNR